MIHNQGECATICKFLMYFYIASDGIFIISLFVSNVNWNMGNMQINFE